MNDVIVIDSNTTKPWMEDGYVGEFAVRQFDKPKREGQDHPGHGHWIDHLTIFYKGPVRVTMVHEVTGEKRVVEIHVLPWVMVLKKEWHHTIEALTEDGAGWFCTFYPTMADEAGISREEFSYERLTHG